MVGFSGKKAYLCGEIKSMALYMDNQEVIISTDLADSLETAIARCPHDKLFVLTDSITRELCLPLVAGFVQGRQQHRGENRDDGDHNQQLD